MTRFQRAVSVFLFLALVRGFRGSDADPSVRAEVRDAVLALDPAQDDHELASFRLNFDLHLTNASGRSLSVPGARPSSSSTVRAAILGVDSKAPDGAWVHLLQSSWYDNGSLNYEACAVLPSGAQGDIAGVHSGFTLLKKQLTGLSKENTLRLHVMFFCRKANGKVSAQATTTEEFRVRVPDQR